MALSTVNDNEPLSKYNPTGLLTFAGGKKTQQSWMQRKIAFNLEPPIHMSNTFH